MFYKISIILTLTTLSTFTTPSYSMGEEFSDADVKPLLTQHAGEWEYSYLKRGLRSHTRDELNSLIAAVSKNRSILFKKYEHSHNMHAYGNACIVGKFAERKMSPDQIDCFSKALSQNEHKFFTENFPSMNRECLVDGLARGFSTSEQLEEFADKMSTELLFLLSDQSGWASMRIITNLFPLSFQEIDEISAGARQVLAKDYPPNQDKKNALFKYIEDESKNRLAESKKKLAGK